ncbi:SGNH/GDSL hydrolase family protein [Propionibacteriaceae bacterium G57]|uniref:SGNH/GDSL hydrolase family protein n=1 Tax=Aestuariimicrobium sp. G57 TaxID=3418485 RepID=UPI003DA71857
MSSTSEPFRLLVLGDSVPAGVGSGGRTYAKLLVRWITEATGRPARAANLAIPGLTTRMLALQLRLPLTRRAVRTADVIVITIGANDLSAKALTSPDAGSADLDAALSRLARRLHHALGEVVRLRGGAAGVWLTGYWNVFADGSVGAGKGLHHLRIADIVTRRTNATLWAVAADLGIGFVDLYVPFKGPLGRADPTRLLAGDGDHPNADGHQVIAETLFSALDPHLTTPDSPTHPLQVPTGAPQPHQGPF